MGECMGVSTSYISISSFNFNYNFYLFFSVSYCPIGSPDPSSECIGEKSVWNTTGEEVTITGLQPWTYYKVISYAEIVIYL